MITTQRLPKHLGRLVAACFVAAFGLAVWPTLPARAATATYEFSYQGQGVNGQPSNRVTIGAGQTATVYLDLKNEGSMSWRSDGANPVRLGTSRSRNRASAAANPDWLSSSRPGTFTGRLENNRQVTSTNVVNPGETARFQFTMRGGARSQEYFEPVVEGLTWFPRDLGVFWEVGPIPDRYAYQWLDQNYAVPTTPSTASRLNVTIRNTGTTTWTNTGDTDTIRLATERKKDRASVLYDASWQSTNRVSSFAGKTALQANGSVARDVQGNLQTDRGATRIAPGEAATFEFQIKSPARQTTAREHFNFVIDGKAWLPDVGISWPVNVPQGYHAQWMGQSAAPTIIKSRNPVGQIHFDFKNTGPFTWQKNDLVRLGTSNSKDRESRFFTQGLSASSNPALPEATANWLSPSRAGSFAGKVTDGKLDTAATAIATGETARFTAALDARNVPPGTYREYFQPLAEGITWLEDYGVHLDVNVYDDLMPQPSPSPSPSVAPEVTPGSRLPADWHKGIVATQWSRDGYSQTDANRSIGDLAATGSTDASFIATWYMNSPYDSSVHPDEGRTPSDDSLRSAIIQAKSRGLRVTLKPHVDVYDGSFRGAIQPGNPAAWFASYRTMLIHYADLAQQTGTTMLIVGTELNSMSGYSDQWRSLIGDARSHCSSCQLTFGASWDAYKLVTFWDALDYIGLDAYLPLSSGNPNPTVDELISAWYYSQQYYGETHFVDDVAILQQRYNKPVIIAELGYQSRQGTALTPWGNDGQIDQEPQRRAYEAVYRVWSQYPWFKGVYWWDWPARDLNDFDAGSHSFRGKAAETLVRDWNR